MMNRNHFLALICIALISCHDEDPSLRTASPGSMQMSIFGRKETSINVPSEPYCSYSDQRDFIDFNVMGYFRYVEYGEVFVVLMITDPVPGDFILNGKDNDPFNPSLQLYTKRKEGEFPWSNTYSWSTANYSGDVAGKISITKLDLSNRLVSGTFEGKVQRYSGSDVLLISGGSFTDIPISF